MVVCLGKGKNERSSLQLDRTKTQHLVSSPSFLLYPEGKVEKWEKFISKYPNTHSDILSSHGVGMSAFSHRRDGSQGSSGWSIPVEEGSGEVSQALDHVWSLRAVGWSLCSLESCSPCPSSAERHAAGSCLCGAPAPPVLNGLRLEAAVILPHPQTSVPLKQAAKCNCEGLGEERQPR